MARRVLMAEVSGERVRGRPRLGWMDGVKVALGNRGMTVEAPLEFFFQEQSYSSLHSGRSLAWDHVCSDTDDPCGAIADFCGVVADFCGVVADPCSAAAIGGRAGADETTPFVARLAKHHKTLLNIVNRRNSARSTSAIARSYRRYRRGVYGDIGDCGVGTTPQMCNRVTNHGDMSTFSKSGWRLRDNAR